MRRIQPSHGGPEPTRCRCYCEQVRQGALEDRRTVEEGEEEDERILGDVEPWEGHDR